MKTIYISENMLNNEGFKKSILKDTLPKDIIDKIINNKTSLGNNPSLPDIFDEPFLLKITEEGFNIAKNELREIGEINDVEDTDLYSALSHLILKCQEIERPYRNQLEKICFNYVIDLFAVPEETVDIEISLKDKVELKNFSINVEPMDGDSKIEFTSVDEILNIKGDVYKRRLLNALIMGASMRLSSKLEEYSNTINEINPLLIGLYRKIIALNYYLLFEKENIGISDENKMQMGTVELSLGDEDTKCKIQAEGVIFPILLSELIRGFMELFISHGLPKDRNKALTVIGKSDFLKAEPWDMKFGPILWDLFSNSFNDINYEELPYLLKRVSVIDVDNFNYLMKEIFAKTKKGKKIMAKISNKSKQDIQYDKFVDKMTKMKQDKNVITDDFIHPEEL
jgi:hypothetical protein